MNIYNDTIISLMEDVHAERDKIASGTEIYIVSEIWSVNED